MLKIFFGSILFSILGLTGALYYGGWEAVFVAFILSVMEVSLSFDNAIVNASVLKDMAPIWRKRFLTWGILIAVFGMRLVFPIMLVAIVTHLNSLEVIELALNEPEKYAAYLTAAHASISAFGGMFLLMVFFGFLFNTERKIHWLGAIEKRIASIGGNVESLEIIVALLILLGVQAFVVPEMQASVLVSGISGLSTYVIIHGLAQFMNQYYRSKTKAIVHSGFMSFVYLEVLDASFSFDGVIGAFAITKDIVIIMIGLGIGAFFVRSLTIVLVQKRTLQNYIYLEHGAHYALGALALMMLTSIFYHIPEVAIGGIGFILIMLSYYSSVRYIRSKKQ